MDLAIGVRCAVGILSLLVACTDEPRGRPPAASPRVALGPPRPGCYRIAWRREGGAEEREWPEAFRLLGGPDGGAVEPPPGVGDMLDTLFWGLFPERSWRRAGDTIVLELSLPGRSWREVHLGRADAGDSVAGWAAARGDILEHRPRWAVAGRRVPCEPAPPAS